MIRYADINDLKYLKKDPHIKIKLFEKKIKDKEVIVCINEQIYIGWLRYNYFWDSIPFLTMIYIEENYRNKGYGKKLIKFWEKEMVIKGYKSVLTSSLSNEKAQNFYRKLGYQDIGSLLLPKEPLEIIFLKRI